jgi:hypothetical protein
LKIAKAELGDSMQAFEFMDRLSMDLVLDQLKVSQYPFQSKFPFYALFETGSLSAPNHHATADTKQGDTELDKVFRVLDKAQDFIIVSSIILTPNFRTA